MESQLPFWSGFEKRASGIARKAVGWALKNPKKTLAGVGAVGAGGAALGHHFGHASGVAKGTEEGKQRGLERGTELGYALGGWQAKKQGVDLPKLQVNHNQPEKTAASREKDPKNLTSGEREKAINAITAGAGSLGAAGYGLYKGYNELPENLKRPIKAGARGYIIGGLLGALAGAGLAHSLLPKNREKKAAAMKYKPFEALLKDKKIPTNSELKKKLVAAVAGAGAAGSAGFVAGRKSS